MAQSVPEREDLEAVSPIAQSEQPETMESHQSKVSNSYRYPPLKRPHRALYKRFLFWIVVLGASVGTGWYVIDDQRQKIISELPEPLEILGYARPGTMTIRAADGTILETTGPATRERLKLSQIPDLLVKAFIAAEDRRFYQHNGVDYQAILRAIRTNLSAGEVVEGGSTITQQLARIVFLNQDPSLDRKVREALLSQEIEKKLTKSEVLQYYLNLVYLGSGAYGVADAAWIYFSKSVDQLSLSEMAMIAGLPPAPSVYSPLENPDLAKERRDVVLERMLEEGYITSTEATAATREALALKPSPPRYFKSKAPYFTTYVKKELAQYIDPAVIAVGGLNVETTIDLQWQAIAQEELNKVVGADGRYENFSQGAATILSVPTGAIKVMIGGTDFAASQFNRVTQAQRQPGSTFKTMVYATAIEAGLSPYQTYVDEPISIGKYKPKNYGGNFRGKMSMLSAMASSVNIVSLKTLLDVGFDPIISIAHKMGIHSELFPDYALALGASEVNLLELTGAYNTLANDGEYIEPHGISRVTNVQGDVLFDAASIKPQEAVHPYTASVMTWMLEQVVDSGTGRPARLNRPVAGKTGTSEQARDLWFVGYIPQLTAGVWLGNDDNQPTYGSSGTAAYLWGLMMDRVTADLPVESFPALPDLNTRIAYIEPQPVQVKVKKESIPSKPEGFEDPEPSNSDDSPSQPYPSNTAAANDYSGNDQGWTDPSWTDPSWTDARPTPATNEENWEPSENTGSELNADTAEVLPAAPVDAAPVYDEPTFNELPPPAPESSYEAPAIPLEPTVEDVLPPPEPWSESTPATE